MAFHAKDGWLFERLEDGSVRIYLEALKTNEIIAEVVVTDSVWASIVSSMSKAGETSTTWQKALDFHKGVSKT